MKSDLLRLVHKADNLERAWRVIQQNGRASTSDEVKLELEAFSEDAPRKLRSLLHRLSRSAFKFEKAKGIPVPKLDAKGAKTGKIRPIVLAPVESRIVQRALLNVLLDIDGLKEYARTAYSFGGVRSDRPKGPGRPPRSEALSAVPAAIQAVLAAIEDGGRFVVCADIRSFFTRIPKSTVAGIIASVVDDQEFVAFVESAIDVELWNLEQLRGVSNEFPIEDMGVAQGNSLSPLLGNIILAKFDAAMNVGDCRCIRYIDDFIIVAPTMKAANARLAKAKALLAELEMELSPEKSDKGGIPIDHGFDFLGIHLMPGLIRPGAKAQAKFLALIERASGNASKGFRGLANGQPLAHSQALIASLRRIDGIIDGWGKHYWFCNDVQTMKNLDGQVSERIRELLGSYRAAREKIQVGDHAALLGMSQLASSAREPFRYPSVK